MCGVSDGFTRTLKLFDGGGLFLQVQPNGNRWWRRRYRFDGKEKLLSLGTLTDVSLKQAREKREEARRLIAAGSDPGEARKAAMTQRRAAAAADEPAGSFEAIAREWVATIHKAKVSDAHAARTLIRFEQDVFPWVGRMSLSERSEPRRNCWTCFGASRRAAPSRPLTGSRTRAARCSATGLPAASASVTRRGICATR